MQLMVSRNYPVVDSRRHRESVARDALFRADDGCYLLYMVSGRQVESEERILFLGCRDALLWLNAPADAGESYWRFAEIAAKQETAKPRRAKDAGR